MEWFVRAFLRSGLTWLGLGVTLGVAMAAHPAWIVYRPAHVHMNLLGFVMMMIFGVAYHVIPRFSGHALHSQRLAELHWWLANVGLMTMVAGFGLAPHVGPLVIPTLAAGGTLSAIGTYLFIFNIWRTLGGRVPAPRPLPLAGVARPG